MLFKNILVGFDGSEPAKKALQRALRLAQGEGSQVTVLSSDETATRYAPGVGEIHEEAKIEAAACMAKAQQAAEIAQEQGVTVKTHCTEGNAADVLLHYAKANAVDLIVVGHAAHSGLLGALLGSTAAKVAEHASCDVLVVR